MCIRRYIFNFQKNKKTRQKAKETKEENVMTVENLTGYDNIVREFALCTFNLLNQVLNFPWVLYEIKVVYVQQEKYSICYNTTTYKVQTFKNKNEIKLLRDILFIILSVISVYS